MALENRYIVEIVDTLAGIVAELDDGHNAYCSDQHLDHVMNIGDTFYMYRPNMETDDGIVFTYIDQDFGQVTLHDDLIVDENIIHAGDTDTYISFTTDQIDIFVGGVNFVTFDEDAADTIEFNPSNTDMDFIINTTVEDYFKIDAGSGETKINGSLFDVTKYTIKLAGSAYSNIFSYSDTSSHAPVIQFLKSHADTETNATTLDAETLARFNFYGIDAAGSPALALAGYTKYVQDGNAASGYVPLRIEWYLSTNAVAAAEKMRLTSAGYLGIGTTSPACRLDVQLTDASTNTSLEVGRFRRYTSSTAAVGLGGFVSYYLEDEYGTDRIAAKFSWGLSKVSADSGSPTTDTYSKISGLYRGTERAFAYFGNYLNTSDVHFAIGNKTGSGKCFRVAQIDVTSTTTEYDLLANLDISILEGKLVATFEGVNGCIEITYNGNTAISITDTTGYYSSTDTASKLCFYGTAKYKNRLATGTTTIVFMGTYSD